MGETSPELIAISTLFTRIRALDAEGVKKLLDGDAAPSVNTMMPARPGHGPLHAVCAQAEMDHRSKSYNAPIDAAARCAKLLIDAGAAVNTRNADGDTPLMIALRSHNQPLIDVLLEAGARPDLVSTVTGMTAFHIAAREGNARVLRTLVRSAQGGAVALATDVVGTPMQLAASLGNLDAVAVIHDFLMSRVAAGEYKGAVEQLHLPAGLCEASGALWLAARYGHADTVRYLVRQNTQLTTQGPREESILGYIAEHGDAKSVPAIDALENEGRSMHRLAVLSSTTDMLAKLVGVANGRNEQALAQRLSRVAADQSRLPAFDRRSGYASSSASMK